MYKSDMAKLLTTSEASERLGVSERRIRSLITEGKLAATKFGRDYSIEESALSKVTIYGKRGRPPKPKQERKTSSSKGK
jgi:excisionase family DNA binding protein